LKAAEKGVTVENIMQEPSVYGKLHHVGVVVRDIDKSIAYLQFLGFGPFENRVEAIDFKGELNDQPEEWRVKICNAQMGDVQLELLEPCGGKSALQESLDATGEGLHHIGFLVDDLDREIAMQVCSGARIWTKAKNDAGSGFVYFKPSRAGGIAIEFRKL
jgi:methylmalonyl-CoA/ethylmalonyl-CoA epimerase